MAWKGMGQVPVFHWPVSWLRQGCCSKQLFGHECTRAPCSPACIRSEAMSAAGFRTAFTRCLVSITNKRVVLCCAALPTSGRKLFLAFIAPLKQAATIVELVGTVTGQSSIKKAGGSVRKLLSKPEKIVRGTMKSTSKTCLNVRNSCVFGPEATEPGSCWVQEASMACCFIWLMHMASSVSCQLQQGTM